MHTHREAMYQQHHEMDTHRGTIYGCACTFIPPQNTGTRHYMHTHTSALTQHTHTHLLTHPHSHTRPSPPLGSCNYQLRQSGHQHQDANRVGLASPLRLARSRGCRPVAHQGANTVCSVNTALASFVEILVLLFLLIFSAAKRVCLCTYVFSFSVFFLLVHSLPRCHLVISRHPYNFDFNLHLLFPF